MKLSCISILSCPKTGKSLRLVTTELADQDNVENFDVQSGALVTEDGLSSYPIVGGIPRFVPSDNYADNFGFQWNLFAKTQLDSNSGHPISNDRFWGATGWKSEELKDKWVLDVGCGAGRFAEIALGAGAKVVALDYSTAVDSCYENLKSFNNLNVVQGDIYRLPFKVESFDFVHSLGVLQHTPDIAKAFACLPPMMSKSGKICVDYYEKSFKSSLLPKYWLRPLTKQIPKQQLFSILKSMVPSLLRVSLFFGGIPIIGKFLKRVIPVANYHDILPLSNIQLREWALLDTFDWLSPAYDEPQTRAAAKKLMEISGLKDIEILKHGHLVARGSKGKCLNLGETIGGH